MLSFQRKRGMRLEGIVMRQTIEAIYENGLLKPLRKLRVPEGRHVKVIVETEDEALPEKASTYDFSDLSGRLSWMGDAVEAQRRIHDEW